MSMEHLQKTISKPGGETFKIISEKDGQFSRIYRVKNMSEIDSNEYVLKRIPITEDNELKRRENEVEILNKFNRDDIIRYVDCWEDGESESNRKTGLNDTPRLRYFYIRMELYSPRTLLHFLSNPNERNSNRDKREIISSIITAVCGLDQKKVIHCGLRPDKILIGKQPNNWLTKIIGFDMAISIENMNDGNRLSLLITKLRNTSNLNNFYVAPELQQLLNSGNDIDASRVLCDKIEVYSLAIMIFEILYPMHDVNEKNRIMNGLRSRQPKFPKNVKKYFTDSDIELLKSMLCWNQSQRISVGQMSHYCVLGSTFDGTDSVYLSNIFKPMFNRIWLGQSSYCVTTNEYCDRLKRILEQNKVEQRMTLIENVTKFLNNQGYKRYSTPLISPIVTFERKKEHFTRLYIVDNICVNEQKRDRFLCSVADLRLEFARSMAVNGITEETRQHFDIGVNREMKRFDIQRMFTPNQKFVYDSPEERWQCAFDIVSPGTESQMAEKHEQLINVLTNLGEIVNQWKRDNVVYILKLNHTDIASEMKNKWVSLRTVQDLRKELNTNTLYSKSLDSLEIMCVLLISLEQLLFDVKINTALDLNLNVNGCIYSGVIFQLEYIQNGETKVLAIGGEYIPAMQFNDKFDFGGHTNDLVAAGVTLNIDNIPGDESVIEDELCTGLADMDLSETTISEQPKLVTENDVEFLKRLKKDGTVLRNFKIIKRLGGGTFGIVYEVQNTCNNIHYALKKIPVEVEKDLNTLKEEVEAILNVSHPNVIRCNDIIMANVDVDESTFTFEDVEPDAVYVYILMELCKETLYKAIEAGSLDCFKKRKIFQEITTGLAHIHEKGIIHRDFHPQNILLTNDGVATVSDFGLSISIKKSELNRDVDDNHNPQSEEIPVRGAPKYLAPELRKIRKEKRKIKLSDYNESSDVYMLGLTYFRLFYPMHKESREQESKILNKLRCIQPQFPADIAEYMSDIEIDLLRRLLHPNPTLRPSVSDVSDLAAGIYCLRCQLRPSQFGNRELLYQKVVYRYFTDIVALNNSSFQLQNTALVYKSHYRGLYVSGVRIRKLIDKLKKYLVKNNYSSISIPWCACNYQYNDNGYNWCFLHSYFGLEESMKSTGVTLIPNHGLHYPFTLYVARNDIRQLKRFDIQKVLRYNGPSLFGSPVDTWQCAIDIIQSKDTTQFPIEVDLKIIQTLDKILPLLQKFCGYRSTEFVLFVNHRHLLSLIDETYDVSYHTLRVTYDNTDEFKEVLECAPRKSVDQPASIRRSNILFLLKDVKKWMEATSCFDFRFKTRFCPGLISPEDSESNYSGIIFQLAFASSTPKEVWNSIAYGGQYNSMIEFNKQRMSAPYNVEESNVYAKTDVEFAEESNVIAVGATINIVVNTQNVYETSEMQNQNKQRAKLLHRVLKDFEVLPHFEDDE